MSNEPTVALAYVHGETVTSYFLESLLRTLDYDRAGDCRIRAAIGQRCTTIALGRNRAVERFLATDLDWLWFVDTDMTFEPDTLERMLGAVNEPAVVAADCWRHDATLGSVSTLRWMGGRDWRARDLRACGMACTMIHRRVFDDVRAESSDPWPWFGYDLVDGVRQSEDLTFCHRARAAGHDIIGLRDVLANHFKLQALAPPGATWRAPQ